MKLLGFKKIAITGIFWNMI